MAERSPQKPTFEERLSDAVFKLIVAGSGGYALDKLYLNPAVADEVGEA